MEIGEGLRELEVKRNIGIDELKTNEEFIDTVLQASQAAMRTSQREKREALRNAVLNSALPHAPDESRRQLFINWIDTLTVWHIRLLQLFADPMKWFQDCQRQPPQFVISSSLSQLVGHAYPEMKNQDELLTKICHDLFHDGLTRSENPFTMMSASGAFDPRATELGNQLIEFISNRK